MSFGKIKSHYYQEDKFAIIEFETPDAATLALSMHNTEIDG
jgi:RNA recognition motif-containing protein